VNLCQDGQLSAFQKAPQSILSGSVLPREDTRCSGTTLWRGGRSGTSRRWSDGRLNLRRDRGGREEGGILRQGKKPAIQAEGIGGHGVTDGPPLFGLPLIQPGGSGGQSSGLGRSQRCWYGSMPSERRLTEATIKRVISDLDRRASRSNADGACHTTVRNQRRRDRASASPGLSATGRFDKIPRGREDGLCHGGGTGDAERGVSDRC
jgi:hypothetical protein